MNTITITKKEYRQLLKNSLILSRLEEGGVNDWEWYAESLNPERELNLEEAEKDIEQKFKDNE